MYTVVTEPENLARHAREYQLLLSLVYASPT